MTVLIFIFLLIGLIQNILCVLLEVSVLYAGENEVIIREIIAYILCFICLIFNCSSFTSVFYVLSNFFTLINKEIYYDFFKFREAYLKSEKVCNRTILRTNVLIQIAYDLNEIVNIFAYAIGLINLFIALNLISLIVYFTYYIADIFIEGTVILDMYYIYYYSYSLLYIPNTTFFMLYIIQKVIYEVIDFI